MMRRGALTLLALTFLALTACGGTAPVESLPEPSESPAASASQTPGVPEPTGEILPEACGRYTAELGRSGAAERLSPAELRLADRAEEGTSESFSVRFADGGEQNLIQTGALGEGIRLEAFPGLTQKSGYGQIAWDGALYHAFTLDADSCTVPNLWPDTGGLLRLNISGACRMEGGVYDCLEGFACVLITGSGTLTVDGTLACGGGGLPLPALMVDGGVTVRCSRLELRSGGGGIPSLALLDGTVLADELVSPGDVLNAGGTLLARRAEAGGDLVTQGGVTLLDELLGESPTMILGGGTVCLAGAAPAGTCVEAGAGQLIAEETAGLSVRGRAEAVRAAADVGRPYCKTTYSEEWAKGSGLHWDSLTLLECAGRYFAGTLSLADARTEDLAAWGGLRLSLSGASTADGDVAGTGLVLTGPGTLRARRLNVWGWGGDRAPLLAVLDGAEVIFSGEEGVAMGSNAEDPGLLLLDGGALACEGGLWMQNGVLEVRSGTLTLDGACALERGRVEITGGTVVLQGGLWLGEGEVVIRGGEVIVPGGLDGLIAERGSVTVEGGTIREP